jgi:hypothetical protein
MDKPVESTEQQERGKSIDYYRVEPLAESPPVDIKNTENYLIPDSMGELTEERF